MAPLREATLGVEAGARRTDATIVGTTPSYQAAARLPIASGRFLSALDIQDRKRVAVLQKLLNGHSEHAGLADKLTALDVTVAAVRGQVRLTN